MLLLVVKRSANWQFKTAKTITHFNQKLTKALSIYFQKLDPQNCSLKTLLAQKKYFKFF